jgi:hypothetical protein
LPDKETLMEGNEPNREPVEELDSLIQRFADSGYAPDGAELEGDHPGHGDHDHDGVRRFEYRGHQVEIATHYEISIDGEPWEGHVTARLDGTVTYHGLPQYAVPSAVALVQAVIDTIYEAPEDVRAAIEAARKEG